MPLTRLICAWLLVVSSNGAVAREYAYSDAHLHYVDFFQETAGMPSCSRRWRTIALSM